MITGNKGEWSEAYAFLKLLADGKLYAANKNLEKIQDIFYPIIKILREEAHGRKRSYVLNGSIDIIDDEAGLTLMQIPVAKFINQSQILYKKIKDAHGRSFGVPEVEEFLNEIDVSNLKSYTGDKSDIKIVVHDLMKQSRELKFLNWIQYAVSL